MPVDARAKNWADDAQDDDELPATETYGPDASGIKTVVSYINEDGRVVKVTRKFLVRKEVHNVTKGELSRKAWRKFGEEAGRKPGPDPSTTTLSEVIPFKLSLKQTAQEEEEAVDSLEAIKKAASSTVICRICKGEHWTSKCPYKDTLGVLTEVTAEVNQAAASSASDAPAAAAGGKYIPPSMRGAAAQLGRKGEPYDSKRALEDASTVRVSNLSDDTQESDIQDLFRHFGAITRTYLARDKITRHSKGFAFVSFVNKSDAQRAIQNLNGYGYDNLILHVEWARQSAD